MTTDARRRAWPTADALWATTLGLLALGLYVATLQPDLGGPEDTPKFQFLGYVLGTAHPPGYPLYVLLSHLFVRLPLGTIAYRANLFSAVMAACACALTFLIARQLNTRRWPAACAAAGLAVGYSVWTSAVLAEVYALAAVMAALTILGLLAWGARGGRVRLLAAVAALALGLGNHLTIVGVVPACVAYVAVLVFGYRRQRLTARDVAAAALVMVLGVSQYGFIILRTHQGAPFLESRARSLRELVAVVTAERFADQRFAFSPSTLVTVQIPEVAAVIGHELGAGGVLLLVAGLVAAMVSRSLGVGLVAGAAAGMLAMIVNLSGDTNGFITPVMPLLWVIAAYGLDAIARRVQGLGLIVGVDGLGRAQPSLRSVRVGVSALVLIAAAVIPAVAVRRNYAAADQSHNTSTGRFYRDLFAQLPARAAIVAEDYAIDSAIQYLLLTGEAGADKQIQRLGYGASSVRAAANDQRRVFALATGATYLGTDGLRFQRASALGVPLHEWLPRLPRGTVIAGAAAQTSIPIELFGAAGPHARAAGSARPLSAFALVIGRPGVDTRDDARAATLTVDAGLLSSSRFAPPGSLVASADGQTARLALAGRTIAEVDFGVVLGVFTPDGALVHTLVFPAGQPMQAPLAGAVYELVGEAPCVSVGTDAWTDVSPALGTGAVLATIAGFGVVEIEIELQTPAGTPRVPVRVAELLNGGSAHLVSANRSDSGVDTLVVALARTHFRRPAFRLALASAPLSGRARVKAGGVQSSVTMCAHVPPSLVQNDGVTSEIRADFDAEAYLGAGWSGAETTPTGSVRRGVSGATLLLPLEPAHAYRLALDVIGDPASPIDVAIDGHAIGTCDVRAVARPCEVTIPASAVRAGVSAVTLSTADAGDVNRSGPSLTFRGARLRRATP